MYFCQNKNNLSFCTYVKIKKRMSKNTNAALLLKNGAVGYYIFLNPALEYNGH